MKITNSHKSSEVLKPHAEFTDTDKQRNEAIKRKFIDLNLNNAKKTTLLSSDSSEEPLLVIKKKIQRKSGALSIDMLLLDEGLTKVYKTFPTICKFRGKGYENQDLKNLIMSYKEWAWMLNPGSAFPDFLLKCESLGKTDACKALMFQLRQAENLDFKNRLCTIKIKKNVSFGENLTNSVIHGLNE
jgi:hypothetical protein